MAPLVFVSALLLGAASPATPETQVGVRLAQPSQTAESEKLVCRRMLKTGSLATYEKVCLTKAGWARYHAQTRAEYGDLQGTKGSTSGK